MLTYFMHIPKTGGMSLQALMRSRYKKPGLLKIIHGKRIDEGFDADNKTKVLMGHFRYGYHRFSNQPYQYCTFMRDPVEHVISSYNYAFDHPEKVPNITPQELASITNFAKGSYGYNLQTRFIAGVDNLEKHGPEQVLQQAKDNIVNDFAFVGFTDDFDASLLRLQRILKWPYAFYVRRNKGKQRQQMPVINVEQRKELEEILIYDKQLYNFAKERFKVELDYSTWRLSSFKTANRIFQKLNPGYVWLKKNLGLIKTHDFE